MATLINGDIFDEKYKNPQTCIVHQCNCIAVKPHGLSEEIAKRFGNYANVYGMREKISNNIAAIHARPRPGTIIFAEGLPNVVALFGQYMYGSFTKGLFWSKNFRGRYDKHIDEGIKKDTKEDRISYFKEALVKLKEFLLNYNSNNDSKKIDTIIFPYGIGCNLAGGDWRVYENEIQIFAKEMLETHFRILIVQKNHTNFPTVDPPKII